MQQKQFLRFFIISILILISTNHYIKSQSLNTLTVGVPRPNNYLISNDIVEQFEALYPELDVQVVEFPIEWLIQNPINEDYSENVRNLVQQADVLVVTDNVLFSALLSENYFLNIAPLIAGDASFDLTTFHPLAIDAFTDEQGSTWGLASGVTLDALFYRPSVFDSIALDYPTTSWSLSDFGQAGLALQALSGKTEILIQSPGLLLSTLWNGSLYQQNEAGFTLEFTNPGFAALLQEWQNLASLNIIKTVALPDETFALEELSLSQALNQEELFSTALYPNNVADLTAFGFAVSAATENPYLAYELAHFLLNEIQLAQRFGGSFPTKLDELRQQLEEFPSDVQVIIQDAMNNPTSFAERLAITYLNQILQTNNLGIENSQEHLNNLAENLNAISRSSLAIATSIPTSASPDQITLRFGIDSDVMSIYFREWRDLIEQFTEEDAEVGAIQLVSPDSIGSFQLLAEESDCFYFPKNVVPEADLELILSLSPLLLTDASFDESDFVGASLLAFEREEQIWGLPLMIAPDVLAYDRVMLENYNVLPDSFQWTSNDFEFALQELQANLPSETAPMKLFQYRTTENTILLLVAAYGGLPFDYRIEPISVDFTNPQTINAIRSVLNLAREGLVDYQHLDIFSDTTVQFLDPSTPIFPLSFGSLDYSNVFDESFGLVSFPIGADYVPLSYRIGTAYISKTTNFPEACYRWLRTLKSQSYLFFGFPAYYSLASDNLFIQDYINLTREQNAIVFPNTIPFYHNVERTWLFRAFDRYVLENADLETELVAAQTLVFELRTCISNIERSDEVSLNGTPRWLSEQARCAVNLDPRLSSILGGLLQ